MNLEQLANTLRGSQSNNHGLTFVITGASSGIGLDAAKLLAMINPTNRIFLVARSEEKANAAMEAVVESVTGYHQRETLNIIPMACDHCSLENVRQFWIELRRQLDKTYNPNKWKINGIDVLCLNAAVLQASTSKAVYTEDGLEVTFQTNHLSPFLIANLAMDVINPGGRVVFSTSGLYLSHKLDVKGMIDPGTRAVRKGFEMMNGSEFHFKRSYAISKLCNVAICLELNKRLRKRNAIASCFSPGLITKSGLFRRQPRCGDSIATVHNKELKEKTIEWGAGSLVYMAIADETGREGARYWSDPNWHTGPAAQYGKEFCSAAISEKLMEKEKREMLWFLSCQLAGIPCDI